MKKPVAARVEWKGAWVGVQKKEKLNKQKEYSLNYLLGSHSEKAGLTDAERNKPPRQPLTVHLARVDLNGFPCSIVLGLGPLKESRSRLGGACIQDHTELQRDALSSLYLSVAKNKCQGKKLPRIFLLKRVIGSFWPGYDGEMGLSRFLLCKIKMMDYLFFEMFIASCGEKSATAGMFISEKKG